MYHHSLGRTFEGGHLMENAWKSFMKDEPEAEKWAYFAIQSGKRLREPALEASGFILNAMIQFKRKQFDQAFAFVQQGLDAGQGIDSLSPVRQLIHKEVGSMYNQFGAKKMALEHIRISALLAKFRDQRPTVRQFRAESDLAGMLLETGATKDAILQYQTAIRSATEIGEHLYLSSAYNNLGMAYAGIGNADSAAANYNRALENLRLRYISDTFFLGSIQDNIGQLALAQGDFRRAKALFLSNKAIFANKIDQLRFFNATLSASKACMRTGELPEAAQLLAEATTFLDHATPNLREAMVLELFSAQLEFARRTGNWRSATEASERMNQWMGSRLEEAETKKIAALEDLLNSKIAVFRATNAQRDSERAEIIRGLQNSRLAVLIVVLGALLVLAVAIILYQRRVTAERQRLANQAIEQARLETKLLKEQAVRSELSNALDLKGRDVSDLVLELDLQGKMVEEWVAELRRISASAQPKAEIQRVLQKYKGMESHTTQARLKADHLDAVNNEFHQKLRARVPDITRSEIELCELIRLRLSSKEIAGMRNITPHSVRVAKYRLKKKFGVDEDLETLIAGM